MVIAMSSVDSSDSSDSSSEASSSSSGGSYESSSFSLDDGSEPAEGVYPFLYEPTVSESSDDGESSDSSEDDSPRLLNMNW